MQRKAWCCRELTVGRLGGGQEGVVLCTLSVELEERRFCGRNTFALWLVMNPEK
jgi:hypothetical protein